MYLHEAGTQLSALTRSCRRWQIGKKMYSERSWGSRLARIRQDLLIADYADPYLVR